MAVDWGDFLSTTAQGAISGWLNPVQPQNWAGVAVGAPPPPISPTVTVNTATGKVTACKRRRRRRLLTESDFNDLMRISTLPNKQNVAVALAKAVGRR